MKMNIELVPFRTPNFVIQKTPPRQRQEGFKEAPKFALNEIPAETLDGLCSDYRREIFEKAGKADPVK